MILSYWCKWAENHTWNPRKSKYVPPILLTGPVSPFAHSSIKRLKQGGHVCICSIGRYQGSLCLSSLFLSVLTVFKRPKALWTTPASPCPLVQGWHGPKDKEFCFQPFSQVLLTVGLLASTNDYMLINSKPYNSPWYESLARSLIPVDSYQNDLSLH